MWSRLKRTAYVLLWLAGTALLTAAILNYALARFQREQAGRGPFVATVAVSRGNFLVYTDDVGSLEAEEFTPVKAETSGQIIGVVPNGTLVKEGDVIVALDVPRMLLAVEEAQRALQEAQDKIETTEHERDAEVEQADLALKKAEMALEQGQAGAEANRKDLEAQLKFDQEAFAEDEKALERKRRLAQQGLIPGQQVRQAEVDLAGNKFALEKEKENLDLAVTRAKSEDLSKQAQVTMAKSALERARNRREDELRSAKFDLRTQTIELQRERDDLQKAFVRAPKAGLVALSERREHDEGARPIQEGDLIRTNQDVAQILDLSKIRVHLELPQRAGQMVKRDQRAIIEVHGLPGQRFPGVVTQVASFASPSDRWFGPATEERSFRTYVRISAFKPGLLKPGMRATARIVVAELKNAVSVPLACVFTRGMGQRERKIVWARRGKHFLAVPVRLGQANEESVVIEAGLKAGAQIALRDLQAETREGTATNNASPAGATPALQQDRASP